MNMKFNILAKSWKSKKLQKIHATEQNTCHLFHTLFTFTERIHLGPKQSFRYVLDVWKEDSAFSVSG